MKKTTLISFFFLSLLLVSFTKLSNSSLNETSLKGHTLANNNIKMLFDIDKSMVSWKGYEFIKSDLSSHYGTAKLKEGEVIVNSSNQTIVSGKAVVDMKSFESHDLDKKPKLKAKLDGHLKGDKFLDVDKFPTATFEVTGYKKLNKKKFNAQISGNLTMKGITKSISFNAIVKGDLNKIELQSEEFDIDRQNWGIKLKDYGESTTKDVVTMQIKLVATQIK